MDYGIGFRGVVSELSIEIPKTYQYVTPMPADAL